MLRMGLVFVRASSIVRVVIERHETHVLLIGVTRLQRPSILSDDLFVPSSSDYPFVTYQRAGPFTAFKLQSTCPLQEMSGPRRIRFSHPVLQSSLYDS